MTRDRRWLAAVATLAVAAAATLLGLRACTERRTDAARPPTAEDDPSAGAEQPSDAGTGEAGPRPRAARPRAANDAPAPAERLEAELTGRVVVRVVAAADGAPVAGADVSASLAGEGSATTGADGIATIRCRPLDGSRGDVYVRARGFVDPGSVAVPPTTDAEARVEVRLERGSIVEVRVRDPDGAPISGAGVDLESETDAAGDATETDAAGVAVATVSPRAPYRLSVWAEGFLDAEELVRSGDLDDAPLVREVRLERAATLVGTVRTPDGAPVAGGVSVLRDGVRVRSEATEPDGTFEVVGLRVGRAYAVEAWADGWSVSETTTAVPEGDPARLRADPVVRPRSAVVVRLVDEDGDAFVDGRIELLHSDGSRLRAWGGAEHEQKVQPGRCVVRGFAAGRVPVRLERDVAPGETWEATLRLVPGAELRGVVADARGDPVEDAWVAVESAAAPPDTDSATSSGTVVYDGGGDDEEPGRIQAESDEDGVFVLRGLPPGRHDVRVEATGFEDASFPEVTAPGDGLRFTLVRRAHLRFRVRFGEEAEPGKRPPRVAVSGLWAAGRRVEVQVSTSEDGVVEVPWWHDAQTEVAIAADGYAPRVVPAAAPRGGVVDLGDVRLVRGVALRGILRYPLGHAARDVPIAVRQAHAPGRVVAAMTKDDGTFEAAGLAPGRATVEALPEDWPRAAFDVEVGSGATHDLVLPRVGVVWVRVVTADGDPRPEVGVRALGGDGAPLPWGEDRTDARGSATLRLAAGRAPLDVGGVKAEADVRPDDVTEVRVTLPK